MALLNKFKESAQQRGAPYNSDAVDDEDMTDTMWKFYNAVNPTMEGVTS